MPGRIFQLSVSGGEHQITVLEFSPPQKGSPGRLTLSLDGRAAKYEVDRAGDGSLLLRDERGAFSARCAPGGWGTQVCAGGYSVLVEKTAKKSGGVSGDRSANLSPPMPSVVARVLVVAGERVEENQGLLVLSAMKMETTLRAPGPGRVRQVLVKAGDRVSPGDRLVDMEPD